MYCGQMVGWIKMKLGIEVGIVPGHIVLDGPSYLPRLGTAPSQFSAHVSSELRLDVRCLSCCGGDIW